MRASLPVVLALALVACSKSNPNYCKDNPDHNCGLDAGSGSGADCQTSDDCTGNLVCDPGGHTCVVCADGLTAACTGSTPVCSLDHACHPCATDAQCPSNACLPDGSCADPDRVLYTRSNGTGTAACTAQDECSIDRAVAIADGSHDVIRLAAGMYALGDTLALAKDLTLVGRGATLSKDGGPNGPTLSISASKTVTLDYVGIEGGDDFNLGHGVSCATATVNANEVTIQNNAGAGISSTGCNVRLERSMVMTNGAGGVALAGTAVVFSLTNNFIVQNGNFSSAVFGGVSMQVTNPSAGSRLEFNTIVDNHASGGSLHGGGLICAGFTAPNNIIARNWVGSSNTATNSQALGDCDYATSLKQDDVAGLAFLSPDTAPYSYKIGVDSSAIDFATTPSPITVDNDGDPRPMGAGKDVGADEAN